MGLMFDANDKRCSILDAQAIKNNSQPDSLKLDLNLPLVHFQVLHPPQQRSEVTKYKYCRYLYFEYFFFTPLCYFYVLTQISRFSTPYIRFKTST